MWWFRPLTPVQRLGQGHDEFEAALSYVERLSPKNLKKGKIKT